MTQEKGFEPMTETAMIIDGIGASATQIANGLVGGFRHIDGSQFTGPKESRDGAGIPFIGFEGRTGPLWDQRRSSNQTRDLELFEASGNHEAARARFVGHLQVGIRMSFADALESFFQSPHIVGNSAEEANLAFGARFSESNGNRVLVDIQTDIECNGFHGVVVCSCSHDESEPIPRPQRGGCCGSAHPGNPRINGRQSHHFFQPYRYRRGARRQP
jgi:hypothetical protein